MEFKIGDIVRVVSFDVFKSRMEALGFIYNDRNNVFARPGHSYQHGTLRFNYKGGHTGVVRSIEESHYIHGGKKYIVKLAKDRYRGVRPDGDYFVAEWLDKAPVNNFNILD